MRDRNGNRIDVYHENIIIAGCCPSFPGISPSRAGQVLADSAKPECINSIKADTDVSVLAKCETVKVKRRRIWLTHEKIIEIFMNRAMIRSGSGDTDPGTGIIVVNNA